MIYLWKYCNIGCIFVLYSICFSLDRLCFQAQEQPQINHLDIFFGKIWILTNFTWNIICIPFWRKNIHIKKKTKFIVIISPPNLLNGRGVFPVESRKDSKKIEYMGWIAMILHICKIYILFINKIYNGNTNTYIYCFMVS